MMPFFRWLHHIRQNKIIGLLLNLVALIWIVFCLLLLGSFAKEEPATAVGIAFVFGVLIAAPVKFQFSFEVRDPFEKDKGNEQANQES